MQWKTKHPSRAHTKYLLFAEEVFEWELPWPQVQAGKESSYMFSVKSLALKSQKTKLSSSISNCTVSIRSWAILRKECRSVHSDLPPVSIFGRNSFAQFELPSSDWTSLRLHQRNFHEVIAELLNMQTHATITDSSGFYFLACLASEAFSSSFGPALLSYLIYRDCLN